ncbi:DUF2860 domain-containing protein [Vibrio sp. Isolate25]|uniref:DUF2860 domain-containing protein n=1 Tax=Vibrio sp. Isolate25 TaxID=2908535 RepID=UPI001EFDF588|nr:DUF2860 domain-containing protein [Vibrio sp. Isolate25]MCG9598697.1 DUF2860 domain-containing protein [Vibrio sp. Isolate25]
MKSKLSLIALSLVALPTMAQLSEHAGLSGGVSLSAGFASTTSNFNTDGDKTINDVNQTASSDSGSLVLPLGNLAYTFGTNLDKQFYVGMAREDIAVGTLALELGYKQQLASGMVIDASFLPTIMSGETWSDPFLTGQERQTTDETGNAFRLKFKNIMGSNFSLDTAYATRDIEDEQSGVSDTSLTTTERNALQRDATSIYLKGDYRLPLTRTSFLQPSITYITTDADGDANSLDSIGGELSYFHILNRHQLALTAGYTNRSYDAENPIYSQTRDEDELSLFAAYEYQDFMGWKNWSLISLAGYSKTDANIDFYDEDQYLVSVGMSYQF